MVSEKKYVYDFSEGKADMKELLGGKGANLAEMTTLGLPVPFGFTITTETCDLFYKNGKQYPEGTWEQVEEKLALLEKKMGMKCSDTRGAAPKMLIWNRRISAPDPGKRSKQTL